MNINNTDYEVGRISYAQNVGLMRFLQENLQNVEVHLGSAIDFTDIFNKIAEKNLLGRLIAYMIKPVGGVWDKAQTENPEFIVTIENTIYEDEIESIIGEFFSKKKQLMPYILSFLGLSLQIPNKTSI